MSRVCSNTPRVESLRNTYDLRADQGDTPRRQNGDERNVRDVVVVQVPIISSWHVVSGRYILERGTSGLAIGSPFPGGRDTTDGEPIATNGKKVKQTFTPRRGVAHKVFLLTIVRQRPAASPSSVCSRFSLSRVPERYSRSA